MKAFLQKFLDADKVAEIEEAYVAKNSGSNGLPIYIPKSRFDEVDSRRKAAEDSLKAVPQDWKEQIENLNHTLSSQKADFEAQLEAQKNSYEKQLTDAASEAERTAKVYGAGARNVKAVLALIDKDKPVDAQIEALQKSDPYLFGVSGVYKGTGKNNDGNSGAGKDSGLSTADMYRAVGLTPPTEK